MTYIAIRRFLAMGKKYKPGDPVPMDEMPNKAAAHLLNYKMVRAVEGQPPKSGKPR